MATVLKTNANGSATSPSADAFNIHDLELQAEQVLAEARLQAENILKEAKNEAQVVLEQAQQSALAAARSEFEQEVQQQAEQVSQEKCAHSLATCASLMEELQTATMDWLVHWREETMSIALRAAEKILLATVEKNPAEVLERWFSTAFATLGNTHAAQISVHPADLNIAGLALQQVAQRIPFAEGAELIADPAIERGGCKVKTEHGLIDMQISAQLRRLHEELGVPERKP